MLKQVDPVPMSKTALRVAAYYRKSPASKDAIEASIEQQIEEVRAYCAARGWILVREYTDGGKSGSRNQKLRTQFHQLIEDSAAGEFNAVIVWHTNRFARLNILKVGKFLDELNENGVHLESVRQGRIDVSTQAGRMALFMFSESDSSYSLNISADSLRGRNATLDLGYWPHGWIPYGYSKQYWEGGKVVATAPRQSGMSKARNWKLKLVVHEEEAAIVRWLFEEFANRDTSIRWLVADLNKRGVPSPTGGKWGRGTVKFLLRNPAFYGACAMGLHSGRKYEAFNRCAPRVVDNMCPPIITKELFDTVRAKWNKRATQKHKPRGDAASPLSGVMVCGHCGYKLQPKRTKRGVIFYCASAFQRPGIGCRQWRIYETEILDNLCSLLVEAIDFEVLERLNHLRQPKQLVDKIKPLRKAEKELAAKVARATENILLVSPAHFATAQKKLDEWQSELERVRNTIELSEREKNDDAMADLQATAEAIKNRLVLVRPGVEARAVATNPDGSQRFRVADIARVVPLEAAADRVRNLLHQINCSVTVSWTPNGKRYFRLDKATIRAEIAQNNFVHRELNGKQEQAVWPGTSAYSGSVATTRLKSLSAIEP